MKQCSQAKSLFYRTRKITGERENAKKKAENSMLEKMDFYYSGYHFKVILPRSLVTNRNKKV